MKVMKAFIRYDILYGHAASVTSANTEFHFHEHYEIYLFMSGDITLFVNDISYTPRRGDLFVFNSNDIHKTLNHQPDKLQECYCIHFLPLITSAYSTERTNLLSCFFDEARKGIHLSSKELESFCSKIEQMISIQKKEDYGSDVLLKTTLIELLVQINLLYQSGKTKSTQIKNTMVNKLISYINEHIQEDLTLEHLAQVVSVDKNYLCKAFKLATGSTIWQYIIAKRISLAQQLLVSGESVQTACLSSGFNDYAHFARTFKNIVGMTAREYRYTYSAPKD